MLSLLAPLSRATFCDANAIIDFLGPSAHMRSNEDVEVVQCGGFSLRSHSCAEPW
jgi:hypothetical protein